jgi:TRAP-type C4-dicarboxylate transport system permease small subunit
MTAYERGKKAVDFAADVVKQLLALSTGILALTITFATDIVGNRETPTVLLGISWIAYILSILFGLWALFAMTGELEQLPARANDQVEEPSIRGRNVTLPAILQIVTFLAATAFIAT